MTLLVIVAFWAIVCAEVDRNQVLDLDFTRPERIRTLVAWSDAEKLNITNSGLGWDGDANAHRDVAIWTLKPMAVGWTWHPLTSMHIEAEAFPPGQFQFTGTNSISWPVTAGDLYVRYSADARHWSTWQVLEKVPPTSRDKPQLRFSGSVGVPEQARRSYHQWINRFASSLGTRLAVDEEAAAKWIQTKDPSFFSTQQPFIGYLDFLWEKEIGGGERVRQLRIEVGYGRGGKTPVPVGHTEKGYWRFKTSN